MCTTHDATEPGIRLGCGHEKLEKASHNPKAEHMKPGGFTLGCTDSCVSGAGSDAHLWTLGTAQTLDPSGRQASTEPQPRQGPVSDKSLHRKDVSDQSSCPATHCSLCIGPRDSSKTLYMSQEKYKPSTKLHSEVFLKGLGVVPCGTFSEGSMAQ